MKYFVVLGVLIICIISALLGLTLGINLNSESTTKYVLSWGSLGDWVAGVGTLFAVAVALWQSFAQSQKDRIRTFVIDKSKPRSWTLRIISEGLIPVTVLGAEICVSELRCKLPLTKGQRLSIKFPQKLERGDVIELIEVDDDGFDQFAEALVAPLVNSLQHSGIGPRDMNYGLNEAYFEALDSHRKAKATMVIRLAHDDIKHDLAPTLIDDLFSIVIAKHRDKAEKDAERKRNDDTEFLNELLKAAPKD